MARSLTITPEETPTTSNLLNGFLFFVILWMAFGTMATAAFGTDLPGAPAAEAR
jgi:hypothetical protein